MTAAGRLEGRALVPGRAEGAVLYTAEPLSFWGGYDAETGEIIDRRHPLSGHIAAGRILALPATRGSSTTTAVLIEAIRRGTAPAAFLTRGPDTFLALAAVVASQLYRHAPPVISLSSQDFHRLQATPRARVEPSGTVSPLSDQRWGGGADEGDELRQGATASRAGDQRR